MCLIAGKYAIAHMSNCTWWNFWASSYRYMCNWNGTCSSQKYCVVAYGNLQDFMIFVWLCWWNLRACTQLYAKWYIRLYLGSWGSFHKKELPQRRTSHRGTNREPFGRSHRHVGPLFSFSLIFICFILFYPFSHILYFFQFFSCNLWVYYIGCMCDIQIHSKDTPVHTKQTIQIWEVHRW
jgi:hypothetical protein